MALLESIRKRGKLLAIVIGLALAAFIVGDFIRSGKSIIKGNENYVAKVNGNTIDVNAYEMEVSKTDEYVKLTRGLQSLDDQTSQQIRSSVWDMIIRENILSNTYDELGINISKAELEDMVYGTHIHPLVQQTFTNPNTGQFDVGFMKTILQNLNKDPQLNSVWIYTEKYIKKDRQYNKYMALVSKGLFVNKLEIQDENTSKTRVANIDIVGKTINDVPDDAVTYTDQDVQAYYDEHKSFYKNYEESRDIGFISFDVFPSKTDTVLTRKDATNNITMFATLNANTLQSTFYTSSTVSSLGLDSSVFDMNVDTIVGPELVNGAYIIARILEFDERPDTVSARHILISPKNPKIGTIQRAQQVADSLVVAINNGSDFTELVTQFSDDQGSVANGGLYEDFTEGNMVKEFNDYCFSKPVGELGTVTTQYGVHIIEVTDRKSIEPNVKIAIQQYPIIASSETYDSVYTVVTNIRSKINNAEDFETIITDNNFVKKEANDITQGTYTIPGIQSVRDVVRWAFKANKDDVSSVFQMPDQYVIAVLENKNEIGFLSLEKVKTQVENSVLLQKKVEKIYNDNFTNANTSDLDALASSLGVQKMSIPNVSFNAFQLANIGYEPAVLAAVANVQQGSIVGPIKGTNGVYVVKATSVTPATELSADEIKSQQQLLSSTLRARAGYQVYTALKTASNIVDRRAVFY